MMGPTRTVLRRLANVRGLIYQGRTQQIGRLSNLQSGLLQPSTPASQTSRFFSLIPGRGDCKKTKKTSKCPKKCSPPVQPQGGCCPHPPPSCASVCRSCPPEKKPQCPLPNRPPQPCHCPYVIEVKNKPGHCPGPCPQDDGCKSDGNNGT